MSSASVGRFLTIGPPGKSNHTALNKHFFKRNFSFRFIGKILKRERIPIYPTFNPYPFNLLLSMVGVTIND